MANRFDEPAEPAVHLRDINDPEYILFIDENSARGRTFSQQVARLGYRVHVASSAAEALTMAGRHRYGVVVASLDLTGTDGLQILEEARRYCPEASRLLAADMGHLTVPVDAEVVDGVITRPWTFEGLSKTINDAFELHSGRSARPGQPVEGPSTPGAPGGDVLLLEHNRGMSALLSALLPTVGGGGHRVVVADHLAAGLEVLGKSAFGWALVDLSLPDARGFETVARVRAAAPHMPIVALVDSDQEELALQALRLGAQDYVVKGMLDRAVLGRAMRYAAERKRFEQKLNYLAYYDQVTGLPNRTLFRERLTRTVLRAKRKGTRVTLLTLGLDRFKSVNDTFGHERANELLKAVANRLSVQIRAFETIGRVGGDEFAIVLDEVGQEEEALRVGDRVLEAFHIPFTIDGQDVVLSSSVGIAFYPENGESIEQLLKSSASAMYRAKECGGKRYQIFSSYVHDKVLNRVSLERDLRGVLERGELLVHYQPQLSIRQKGLVAVEALVRWRHETRGLIGPLEFIPLLEDSGLIRHAGEWILRSACSQLRQWQGTGFADLRVAVNLSPRQFEDPRLPDVVDRALADFELLPQSLELEITENVFMQDTERTRATLAAIKALGVRIAIDDFGTGYSSLAYLRRIPIDSLKIDKSFVQDITTVRRDGSIAAAIIGLGHSLRLQVVAEGVETEEQLAFLREEGCDAVQGFLCGRPAPARPSPMEARHDDAGGAAGLDRPPSSL